VAQRTLPEYLSEAGYTTRLAGKWHLGSFEKGFYRNK